MIEEDGTTMSCSQIMSIAGGDFTASLANCAATHQVGSETMNKMTIISHALSEGCCGARKMGKCDAYKVSMCKNADQFLPDAHMPNDDSDHDHSDHAGSDHEDEETTCGDAASMLPAFTASSTTCAETMAPGMGTRGEETTKAAQVCCRDKIGACSAYTSGGGTTVATPKTVSHVMSIAALDYDKLDASKSAEVISKVKEAYLTHLSGYTASDLTVALSAGSIKATVTITPKAGATSGELVTALVTAKSAVETQVIQNVNTIVGVASLLEDGKTLTDVTATSTAPLEISAGATAVSSASPCMQAVLALFISVFLASQL
jgi:hypothetical protein